MKRQEIEDKRGSHHGLHPATMAQVQRLARAGYGRDRIRSMFGISKGQVRRILALLALLAGVFLLASCAQPALTVQEQARYQKILDRGLPAKVLKTPALAVGLNLIGGLGYCYLEDWGNGLLAFILAPVSWIWSMPAAYFDARRLNVRYTLEYYRRLETEER